MRIAIDAMGGDFAPIEVVKGAVLGSRLHDVDVILVGNTDEIKQCLPCHLSSARVTIRHASEVIDMHEQVDSVRTKKDASIVVAATLVKEGEADAMVSVGNTAAAMAAATLRLGRIRGIDRPAIATFLPNKANGVTVMLDAGAVVDCTPEILVQFALMGSIYCEKVLGIQKPQVGLLSIGEEKTKGNELTRRTYDMLIRSRLNFVGNVEGRDLFSGAVDVMVADGFVGNVALKTAEGLVDLVKAAIKERIRTDPLAWLATFLMIPGMPFMIPAVKRLKRALDYSEYGGAPLLGIDGVCIIGHGRSNARAVASAIMAAKEAVSRGMVKAIRDSIAGEGELVPEAEQVLGN